jgi:hypothetical protein
MKVTTRREFQEHFRKLFRHYATKYRSMVIFLMKPMGLSLIA